MKNQHVLWFIYKDVNKKIRIICFIWDSVMLLIISADVLQSPKKAKKKESGSSNVFTMFEQSQIQEFKEARAVSSFIPTRTVWYMIFQNNTSHNSQELSA